MTSPRVMTGQLSVEQGFKAFVDNELLPAIGIEKDPFWSGVESIITALTPRNRELLARRDDLQARIDDYHRSGRPVGGGEPEYIAFLREIGYLKAAGESFVIQTSNVDPEIATVAGPQLVVPVSNGRFALNAANARWGSLYDALYGTDVIDDSGGKQAGGAYNPKRGAAVIAYAARFLDEAVPIAGGSHCDVAEYRLRSQDDETQLEIAMTNGSATTLRDPQQFRGHARHGSCLALLFVNHGLHLEIRIDAEHPIGSTARAQVADVVLESAVTAIQDCEDSVSVVDAFDKTQVYRNWFGLMQGTLTADLSKQGKAITRRLNKDRLYQASDGGDLSLPGRSLLLVRNVGHLMQNDAILDADGNEVFEGILDAIMTTACALNDLLGRNTLRNSRSGSLYIVKPKMHGPDEVAFTDQLMAMVEDLLGLNRYTVKIGVMDEERRTTVNLMECIRAVEHRLVFINTGFLDRTGDEIHTSMHAGAMLRKEAIKLEPWIQAYEDWNVDIGIRCGLPGKAQIGKGMWPKTDEMREMVETKTGHLQAGANCAWVPSPTAASLHAMHYHKINVADRQRELASRPLASFEDLLTPPLAATSSLTEDEIQSELDNNAQGILGYVVRWIDQGVGCSKVPDIHGTDLMEDKATLRISSQHIANWLLHGICSEQQVRDTLLRMAAVVDEQNAGDPAYRRMSDAPDQSLAFQAACDLIFEGVTQPNGYTEPLLHGYRRKLKATTR